MKKIGKITAVFLAAIFLTGCAALHPPMEDPPQKIRWTASEYVGVYGDSDPWEGFNRSMFAVQNVAVLYLVRPLGWVWTSILPDPVLECLRNATHNLAFPGRVISCFLQARWGDGGIEFSRFLINTTVGIAGLFDPSTHWFDIHERNEDFGQAFAAWGCGTGYTLMLPGMNGSNVRDVTGNIFDKLFDVSNYLPYGISSVLGFNRAVLLVRDYKTLVDANADPYEVYKSMAVLNRQLLNADLDLKMRLAAAEKKDQAPKPMRDPVVSRPEGIRGKIVLLSDYRPENVYSDAVRSLMFKPQTDQESIWNWLSVWNRDFTSLAEVRKISAMRSNQSPMEFYFWRSPDAVLRNRAPLAVILPGIGSHYTSQSAVAMAELLYRQGYAVMVLPSVFNWTYYQSMLAADFPGYAPDDARSLQTTIAEILRELAEEDGKDHFEPESLHIVGSSLGGVHALHLAALEEKMPTLKAARYVAVNPPVSLMTAARIIDGCGKTATGWSQEKIADTVLPGYAIAMGAARQQQPWRAPLAQPYEGWDLPEVKGSTDHDYRTHLSADQAKILASVSFGFSLRDVMMVACRDQRVPGLADLQYAWSSRTRFYRQIDRMGFEGYIRDWVIPSVQKRHGKSLTAAEIDHRSGLRGIESTLQNNPSVRILANLDDFLLTAEDRRFLDSAAGNRITWFARGSHLGNLYYGSWQKRLLEALEK